MEKLISSYATISKSIVIQALGVQRNFVKYENTAEIDELKSGCYKCPHYQENGCARGAFCSNCPSKAYVQKVSYLKEIAPYKKGYQFDSEETVINKVYVNERDKYGKLPSLSLTSLKLLLSLFFMRPTSAGMVEDVNINELAAYLGCERRSVINNMKSLRYNGYIRFSPTVEGCTSILILDYSKTYAKASGRGKGFFYLSKQLLDELVNMKSVNSFRISLRTYIDIDELNISRKGSKFGFYSINKNMKSIMNSLPRFCRPSFVRKTLENNKVFDVRYDNTGKSIHFCLHENYCGKNYYLEKLDEAKNKLTLFIKRFEDAVDLHNLTSKIDNRPSFYKKPDAGYLISEYGRDGLQNEFGDVLFNSYNDGIFNIFAEHLSIPNSLLEPLSKVAAYYTYERVKDALKYIYTEYILRRKRVDNWIGLVKNLLDNKFNDSYYRKLMTP